MGHNRREIPFDHRVRVLPDQAHRPSWAVTLRDGKPVPYFMCACGKRGALDEHKVSENGEVDPSVWHEDCGFHEYVRLESWPGAEALKLGPLLN